LHLESTRVAEGHRFAESGAAADLVLGERLDRADEEGF